MEFIFILALLCDAVRVQVLKKNGRIFQTVTLEEGQFWNLSATEV